MLKTYEEKLVTMEGFKKSKIGWIPEDWNLFILKDILRDYKLGGNYGNSQNESNIPLIKMGNLGRGNMVLDKLEYLSENETIKESDILNEGDVLFNTRNTLELVGKVAIWKNELIKAVYNSNLLRLKFNDIIDNNDYMNYCLNSYNSTRELRRVATGTTSVAAIYTKDLLNIKIPIPPLLEQRKIASILTDWDEAIKKTQTLIKKLELRKKGLMQQLLTGKTRLAGFGEEWQERELGYYIKSTPRPKDKPSEPFLALGLRSHGKGIFHKPDFDPSSIAMDTLYEIKENDLVVNITFAWEHAIAIANKEDEGGLVSHRFPTFTFKENISDAMYFRYYVLQPRFKYLLGVISPGGAGRNRVMSKKDFPKLIVKVPPYEEQKAISAVLQSVDQEIEQQQNYLKQLQIQKKGLMQQLLTGKIRTV